MDFGKVEYIFTEGREGGSQLPLRAKLTLIGQGDEEILMKKGLASLRRRRILRLTQEANEQGALLSYKDLMALLLTSFATLKRDVAFLERHGHNVPVRGKRKNGNGSKDENNGCNGCSHCNGADL